MSEVKYAIGVDLANPHIDDYNAAVVVKIKEDGSFEIVDRAFSVDSQGFLNQLQDLERKYPEARKRSGQLEKALLW